jgi:ribosomal protein L27
MAHKKGGSSRNGRDSAGQRLGLRSSVARRCAPGILCDKEAPNSIRG